MITDADRAAVKEFLRQSSCLLFGDDKAKLLNLVSETRERTEATMYPIFDILPRLWASGFKTVEQDGEWHLFEKGGDGLMTGKTFRELCVNIVLGGM